MINRISTFVPILDWGRHYNRQTLASDTMAAVIVTIMLVPQSLAYAMLAGLPAKYGLYASILPLVVYAVFGTSRTLAVGPVAVASLMTASAAGTIAAQGSPDYVLAAVLLAILSGAMLLAMGIFRLGFLANFLSHPVISGFISASGILIAASQIKHILGISVSGDSLVEILTPLAMHAADINPYTLALGAGVLAFLYFVRLRLKHVLTALGMPAHAGDMVVKAGPVLAVVATIALASAFDLGAKGVALVGEIPQGLPALGFPQVDPAMLQDLAIPALLISLIGFVESVSVAQTLASKRRQRIVPDQELVALGAANIASSVSSGFPVTGGFARSVVNFDAGAQTPAAGIFTAAGIAVTALFFTPYLAALPQATLAATIIVAVLSLVDVKVLRRIWTYSKIDFIAMAATILGTLFIGVETGVVLGVVLSLVLHLYRTSTPHIAIVGNVPGSEHFRNVERHDVLTVPEILTVRVDESLYFANSRFLEDRIAALVAARPEVRHLVLMCSAVNAIDASALESLEEINHRLKDAGIMLHLSEVKGPVMDRLRKTDLLEQLTGKVFLSQYDAFRALCTSTASGAPDLIRPTGSIVVG
ncbi:sulfate permease [Rhizobiaceae bacterium n13]|uniref:Sulfate permease n=1 Tax=Ferirhizobium litorale TaxID=2927786 RepID=A0AAE3QDF4_9HYPH|nr:sulfate permease [Fererhizobium litorale]MDI7861713.1 sulfate permease [Fererhizobium litorale]MDI7921945.1 sulfate permease [Fererhizobium litorale]